MYYPSPCVLGQRAPLPTAHLHRVCIALVERFVNGAKPHADPTAMQILCIFSMQMVAMQFHDADEQKLHYSDCNAEFCIAHDADSSASQLHRILS
jgi:hypothetical protein